jgi:hypothetical protein
MPQDSRVLSIILIYDEAKRSCFEETESTEEEDRLFLTLISSEIQKVILSFKESSSSLHS